MSFDVPQAFERHVFMCAQSRPPGHPMGSCGERGAAPLWEYLSARIDQLGTGEIGRTPTGCLGLCSAGPVLVVYPEGVWCRPQSKEDVDKIIDTHLTGGELVEDRAFAPR